MMPNVGFKNGKNCIQNYAAFHTFSAGKYSILFFALPYLQLIDPDQVIYAHRRRRRILAHYP